MHMHILSHLLEMYLPELDNHLHRLGVSWDMFTSKLVLTLCSSYIPLEYLSYIYDVFFMVTRCQYSDIGWLDRTVQIHYCVSWNAAKFALWKRPVFALGIFKKTEGINPS